MKILSALFHLYWNPREDQRLVASQPWWYGIGWIVVGVAFIAFGVCQICAGNIGPR